MLAFVHIPEQIPKPSVVEALHTLPPKLDLVRSALFAPSAIQLLLALQHGGVKYAWNSSQVIGLFCSAGATFIVFLVWDYRKGDTAMIPFSMVRKRIVWSSSLSYGFLMGQLFCTTYYLPIDFQGVKGSSPMLSGVYILRSMLARLFAALVHLNCLWFQSLTVLGRTSRILPAHHGRQRSRGGGFQWPPVDISPGASMGK